MAAVPDPRHGVFETLLVVDGRPVELDAHLARLEASLAELYPGQDLPSLDVPVVDPPYRWSTTGTSAGALEALRIAVAPSEDGGLGVRIDRRNVSSRGFASPSGTNAPGAISVESLALAGGLGAHKWADRSLVDEAQAKLPADALSLIVDDDGAVLEASRANVFAVQDGALVTPPLDGRILPGITRMRVLGLAGGLGIEAGEATLTRADLLAADEVFLTGSVRGIERVHSLDGAMLAAGGSVASNLAAALWQAWASVPVG